MLKLLFDMRTRSKTNSPNPESNGQINMEGRRSKRLVEISKTIIFEQNIKDKNGNVQSNDKSAVRNIRKRSSDKSIIYVVEYFKFLFHYNRTQTKSKSNTFASVSNGKTPSSEQPVTIARTNKRKRDENEPSTTDMQTQRAADKTEALYRNSNNKIVSKSNTVNCCELRCKLRSQSGTLSKEKEPIKKLSSNEENFKTKSNGFSELSSDVADCHITQSYSKKETVDVDVPSQRWYVIVFL